MDVEVDDAYNRNGINTVQRVAGSVGLEFENSGDHRNDEHGLDTVTASSTGWCVYEKDRLSNSHYSKPAETLNDGERMY